MKLICNSLKCNGNIIPYMLLDGYAVGDRLMEGVLFQVSLTKKAIKVDIDLSCADYFSQFNKSAWYKKIENWADDMINDGDLSEAQCCMCYETDCVETV